MRSIQKLILLFFIRDFADACWLLRRDDNDTLTIFGWLGVERPGTRSLTRLSNRQALRSSPNYVGTLDGAELLMAGEATDLLVFMPNISRSCRVAMPEL